MHYLSNFIGTKIAVLHEQRVSKKEIARQLGITVRTARLWMQRYLSTGDVKPNKPGRISTVYTSQRHRDIVNHHAMVPFASTGITAQRYGISLSTVRRHLHAGNIYNYRPARKIELTLKITGGRINFANEYVNFDWENNIVIFSDEKTFRSDTDGRKILWSKPNERYLPQNIQPVRASGRITLGDANTCRLLLSLGAEVDQPSGPGQTPLHLAALAGDLEIIDLLLESGADFQARDWNGLRVEHYAADSGRVAALRRVLERGGDVAVRDHNGWTPLFRAVCQGASTEMAAELVSRGSDVGAVDRAGLPLATAARLLPRTHGRRRESLVRLVDASYPQQAALGHFTRLTNKIHHVRALLRLA